MKRTLFLLLVAHAACGPTTPRVSTVVVGHTATMDVLGYDPVGQRPETTIARGETRSHNAVMRAGRCYRAVAMGVQPGLDLEIAMYTPGGARAAESITSGHDASVSYCASASGTFRAAVSARAGGGTYMFALWERNDERTGEAAARGTCTNPLTLELGGRIAGSFVAAQDNAGAQCVAGRNPDMVHVLELTRRQRVQLSATGDRPRALYIRRTCGGGGAGAGAGEGPALACDVPRDEGAARVDTTLDPGRYYVVVETPGDGLRGRYELVLNEAESPELAGVCANAMPLPLDRVVHGTTQGKADAMHGTCAASRFPGPDALYSMELPARSRVRLNVEGETAWDTGVYIRSTCNDPASEVACNDDADTRSHSEIGKTLSPGRYSVIVDGYATDAFGPYTIGVETSPPEGRGIGGDRCDDARTIGFGQRMDGDTFAARNDGAPSCGGEGPDEWFRFTLNRRMYVRASLAESGIAAREDATRMAFYRNCGAQGASRELSCTAGLRLDAVLDAGTHYLVVDGASVNDYGRYSIALDSADAEPIEAACRAALPISIGQRVTGTTARGSDRLHASCGYRARSPEQVYSLRLSRRSRVVVEARATTFDPVVYVRRSCEREATEVGCSASTDDHTASTTVELDPGNYAVVVDGFDQNNSGEFTLDVRAE